MLDCILKTNLIVYVRTWWQNFIADEGNKDILFLIAWACFLFDMAMSSTMYKGIGSLELVLHPIMRLCWLLKFIFFDKYTRKEMLLAGTFLATAIAVSLISGYSTLVNWVLVYLFAKDVNFEKILKTYFIIVGSVELVTVLGACLDIIPNLQYYYAKEEVIRYALGGVYPTNFAGLIFFLMLTYLYLNRHSLNFFNLSICTVIAYTILELCHARLDSYCMFLAIVGFALLGRKKLEGLGHRGLRGLLARYGQYSMPMCAIVIFLLSWCYDPNIQFMAELDDLLSTRLSLGYKGLMDYKFLPFGQSVYLTSIGGFAGYTGYYFYLDSSYINYFLRYGYVFTGVIIYLHMACCQKYKDDLFFLYAIALISINGAIAHHLVDFIYNVFPMALVAKKHVDWWNEV